LFEKKIILNFFALLFKKYFLKEKNKLKLFIFCLLKKQRIQTLNKTMKLNFNKNNKNLKRKQGILNLRHKSFI